MNKNNLINLFTNPQPIPAIYNEGFSQYETITYLINYINNLIENQNLGVDEIEDLKNKKIGLEFYLNDLANNRKLSETGDFTGTWHGYTPSQVDIVISSILDSHSAQINQIIQNTLPLKASTEYVDNIISLLENKINSQASGSPKGVFNTLLDLTTTFPTGANGIYIITSDGGWYYWSGSAWVKGGTYQSSGLPINLGDYLVSYTNMVDKTKFIANGYIGANGAIVNSSGYYYYGDYIPVDPSKPLAFSGCWNISFQLACYDSNKNYIGFVATSNTSGSLGSYTITNISHIDPALVNTAYVRPNTTQPNEYMMVQDSVFPSTYSPYGMNIKSSVLKSAIILSIQGDLGLMSDSNSNTSFGKNTLTNKGNTKFAVAIGENALQHNTTTGGVDDGLYNVAVGYGAMQENTIGNHNTALGYLAMRGNTTGTGNTAVGEDSLLSETTGSGNTALGMRALQGSTNAQHNVAVGESAMYWDVSSNVTGSDNVAVGHYAGSGISSDTDLTFVGHFAGKDDSTKVYSNSSSLGANAKVTKSNQVQLGNTGVTEVNTYGDFQTLTNGKGLIVKSDNGSKFRITVSNDGQLVVTSIS